MKSKNKVALLCVALVVGMTGAGFAAVPLYRMFCQVTGFDGTVKKAEAAPNQVLEQEILIRFDTNVRDLPMTFKAEQLSQKVHIGETGMAYFTVTNTRTSRSTPRPPIMSCPSGQARISRSCSASASRGRRSRRARPNPSRCSISWRPNWRLMLR